MGLFDFLKKDKEIRTRPRHVPPRERELTPDEKAALEIANRKYCEGLVKYALGDKSAAFSLMETAAEQEYVLSGVYFAPPKMISWMSAKSWLRHHAENSTFGPADSDTEEGIADSAFNNKTEAILRKLGLAMREGFRGIPPYPDLWEDLRYAAFKHAGAKGFVRYVLDEDISIAKPFFESYTKDHSPAYMAYANLGLANLRLMDNDPCIDEAIEFVRATFSNPEYISDNELSVVLDNAKNGDIYARKRLSLLYDTKPEVSGGDEYVEKLGKLFAHSASVAYENVAKEFIINANNTVNYCGTTYKKSGLNDFLLEWMKFELKNETPNFDNTLFMCIQGELPYMAVILNNETYFNKAIKVFGLDNLSGFCGLGDYYGYNIHDLKTRVRNLKYELYQFEHRNDPCYKSSYSSNEKAPTSDEMVDSFLDSLERLTNENGMTNKELHDFGYRSDMDNLDDELARDAIKGWFN